MHFQGAQQYTLKEHSALSSRPSSTQPQPAQPVQNTKCGSAHACSTDDGHNDVRIMLRQKFDNKGEISLHLVGFSVFSR